MWIKASNSVDKLCISCGFIFFFFFSTITPTVYPQLIHRLVHSLQNKGDKGSNDYPQELITLTTNYYFILKTISLYIIKYKLDPKLELIK